MGAPFMYVGTYTIKEGKLEGFSRYWKNFASFVEQKEPRLIAFEAYISEDGTEASVVQVHPDAASMAFHMEVIRDHLDASVDFLDAKGDQIYANPGSEALVAQLRQFGATEGYPVTVKSELTGFNRLPVAAAV